MSDWLPTHVRTALIYTTKTFALERSSTEQSEDSASAVIERFAMSPGLSEACVGEWRKPGKAILRPEKANAWLLLCWGVGDRAAF